MNCCIVIQKVSHKYKIGYTVTVKHRINCKDDTPIKQRPYPISLDKRKFVLGEIKEIECQELIEPSASI